MAEYFKSRHILIYFVSKTRNLKDIRLFKSVYCWRNLGIYRAFTTQIYAYLSFSYPESLDTPLLSARLSYFRNIQKKCLIYRQIYKINLKKKQKKQFLHKTPPTSNKHFIASPQIDLFEEILSYYRAIPVGLCLSISFRHILLSWHLFRESFRTNNVQDGIKKKVL